MRDVPKLQGPFTHETPQGKMTYMTWVVMGDNRRFYHTQFEVPPCDLLAGDLACHKAFVKLIEIATHHPHAPVNCVCFYCLGLLAGRKQ